MVSATTLISEMINVKGIVVDGLKFTEKNEVKNLQIKVHLTKHEENRCPYCGRKCQGYDHATSGSKTWRGLDFSGVIVKIESRNNRIKCPIHGVFTAAVPWAYPGSSFTKSFDMTVAWLSTKMSKSAIAEYMRIDWETTGRCISRALNELEPDRTDRLNGLVNIGIDETSYKKGHKYITVVVNHDTNTVVWASEGHGKGVLEKFFHILTPEQRATIKVVTGDGAKWITECVNEFLPNCARCVDPFHVVEWAMDAVDEVRRQSWREAQTKAKNLEKAHPRKQGRPKVKNKGSAAVAAARKNAAEIKSSSYALGKAPENLTPHQQLKLDMIAAKNPRLYRAYCIKESLRLLLKLEDVQEADIALKKWLWWASHSRIPSIVELNRKIRRHKQHILNTIRFKMSNARIEATNNKIKLIIRLAYGFHSIQHLLDMVLLVCSNLAITLPNR